MSPLRLIEESGVIGAQSLLSHGAVFECLERRPDLVKDWLQWSDDKRVSEGWYFQLGPPIVVAYYPRGPRMEFETQADACAEFIVREIQELIRHAV